MDMFLMEASANRKSPAGNGILHNVRLRGRDNITPLPTRIASLPAIHRNIFLMFILLPRKKIKKRWLNGRIASTLTHFVGSWREKRILFVGQIFNQDNSTGNDLFELDPSSSWWSGTRKRRNSSSDSTEWKSQQFSHFKCLSKVVWPEKSDTRDTPVLTTRCRLSTLKGLPCTLSPFLVFLCNTPGGIVTLKEKSNPWSNDTCK